MTEPTPQRTSSPATRSQDENRKILAALARIEARMTRVEGLVGGLRRDGEALAATAMDTIDSKIAGLEARGIDVDARIRAALELVEKLSDPESVRAVESMVDLARNAPASLAAVADTFDGVIERLASSGVDVDSRIRVVLRVLERLTAPEALAVVESLLSNVDQVQYLLDSGIFDPAAVRVLARAAGSIGGLELDKVEPVGLFGAMRALRQRDSQRALGVLVAFSRCFGRAVADPDAPCANRSKLEQG